MSSQSERGIRVVEFLIRNRLKKEGKATESDLKTEEWKIIVRDMAIQVLRQGGAKGVIEIAE